jgi:hypothetical protein
MNRKKVITKIILAAVILFIISGAFLIYETTYIESMENKKTRKKNTEITGLTNHYQKYLDEIAKKITEVPLNPYIISQIKSDIFKKMPDTELYLWMSDVTGEFIFGEPSPAFTRLNKAFDKYRNFIEKDGYYVDRNDFLLKLIHKHSKIRFSQFDAGGQQYLEDTDWRFYKERLYPRDYRIALSSPAVNKDKQSIGDLYLKVAGTYEWYDRKDFLTASIFPVFRGLMGFAGFLLWFLLPSWVYIDARERDVKNVYLWVILTIISFGFAFLIYLITRPPTLKSFLCPECQKELNGTKAFCPYCGFDLSSSFCPQCQYPIKPEWQFCPNCRFDMKQKPQTEVPEETT